jgi:hypothetical protein
MATNEPIKTVIIDRPGPTPPGSRIDLVKMQPIVAILIRAARTYLQSLIGFLALLMTTDIVPLDGFADAFVTAASWAVAPAAIALLHNLVELLGRLDETAPQIRG